MRDALDVDAACRDVGRHEDAQLVVAEPLQRLLPRRLRHVAMKRRGREAAIREVVGDALGLPLRTREDDRLRRVGRLQEPADHLGLVEVVRLVDVLRRLRHRLVVGDRLGPDVHGLAHVRTRQRHDRRRHRRAEQHRLARPRRQGQQPLDVGQEPEVEHLVGLVEHQGADEAEVEGLAVREVQQAARGADDDLDAPLERVELGLERRAAVDAEHPVADVLAGQRQVAVHLQRELTGRGDDERLRLAGLDLLCVVGVVRRCRPLDQRDAESEGLAGAGAGLTDEVGASQGDLEGHLLDGEGLDDAGAFKGVCDPGVDPEVSEGGQDTGLSTGVTCSLSIAAGQG